MAGRPARITPVSLRSSLKFYLLCQANSRLLTHKLSRMCKGRKKYSSSCLHESESYAQCLLDFFIFVMQKRERISNVVPLSLVLATCKSSCKFISQLLRVLVLEECK